MDSIVVRGGNKLNGNIKISGAKNATLPIMAACILTEEDVKLTNVPRLVDIETMHFLIRNHGSLSEWTAQNEIKINSANIHSYEAPYDIVRKMRASIWVLGPLLARFGKAKVSMPGGCAIGARMVDQHISVMQALGADVKTENGYVIASSSGKLKGCEYDFKKISVGATINGLLASVLAEGKTILSNCAFEPEITDLCQFLKKMGANISGIGSRTLEIEGVEKLSGCNHEVIGDRIEAGTYLAALGITGGDITFSNIRYDIISNILPWYVRAGINIDKLDDNSFKANSHGKLKATNLETEPFPGFATDLQAQFLAMMTTAEGVSTITENIFENRFMHVPELARMGANIIVDQHSAIVTGVEKLNAAEVMASDLRASSSLILGSLGADGESKVRRIYHLDRGYEKLEEKLTSLGADIHRIKGDKI